MIKTIFEYNHHQFTWINVTHPGEKEVAYLSQQLPLLKTDQKEILPPLQRPKIVERPEYIFIVLVFPIYDRETRVIHPTELDIIVTNHHLVTIHSNELSALTEFHKEFKKKKELQDEFLSNSPYPLLAEILGRLYVALFPMLNHISNDIEQVESEIFFDNQPHLISDILLIQRNIIAFRKALQSHRNLMKKTKTLLSNSYPHSSKNLSASLNEIIEYTEEIWNDLENYDYSITTIHQSHESLTSYRLNTIMKTLTVFSVIILPLTLITGLFGMNTVNMPIVEHSFGFWIIIALMFSGTFGMLAIFKLKRWL